MQRKYTNLRVLGPLYFCYQCGTSNFAVALTHLVKVILKSSCIVHLNGKA